MVRSKRIPADADPLDAQSTGVPSAHSERPPRPKQRWARRPLAAAAWIVACLALFAFYLRISFVGYVTADGANIALQAWDVLHGNVLLHGWYVSEASFYTLDLPVLAVTEIFFGLCDLTSHVASALTYLIVTVSAVALALTDSRGLARVARCGVVVAVLTAMFHVVPNAPYLLGPPDHTGTSAFLLVSFLLIDRAPARPFAPPLLCAILAAGQIGDATIRYVAVPAVVVVCGYRAVAARSLRTGDAANALAAIASVPLASAVRVVMLHFGAYQMVAPQTAISRPGQWPLNATFAWQAIRVLFGAQVGSGSSSLVRDGGYILGLACLLAAAAGFARVVVTWRAASRAEQLLCAAIVINISVYVIWTLPGPTNPFDIVAVLPCGAVLAARVCVPGHITGTLRTGLTAGLAFIAALVPLTVAAVQPAAAVSTAPLSAWLRAHGLTYGLAEYWNSSVITLNSGNAVQVRAVIMHGRQVIRYDWETDTSWFDASQHDATFVIIDRAGNGLSPSAESYFGKPVQIVYVTDWAILIYHKNLLRQVAIPGTAQRSLVPPGATARPPSRSPLRLHPEPCHPGGLPQRPGAERVGKAVHATRQRQRVGQAHPVPGAISRALRGTRQPHQEDVFTSSTDAQEELLVCRA